MSRARRVSVLENGRLLDGSANPSDGGIGSRAGGVSFMTSRASLVREKQSGAASPSALPRPTSSAAGGGGGLGSVTFGGGGNLGSVRTGGGVLTSIRTPNNLPNKPTNVQLAVDPNMPPTLMENRPVWTWLLIQFIIIGVYVAAFVLAGYSLPTPQWSDSNDKLTIIGWIFHLLGALFFLLASIAIMIKKGPFFPKILTSLLLALFFFIVGSVFHTTHLGVSSANADLLAADPKAVLSSGTSITDSIGLGGGKANLSIRLQWLGDVIFYIYMSLLIWKAPASSANIATATEISKHRLLMELRELAQYNLQLTAQLDSDRTTGGANPPMTSQTTATSGGAVDQDSSGSTLPPDILTIERPETAPKTNFARKISTPISRPRTGQVADESSMNGTVGGGAGSSGDSVHLQHALAIQEALDAEAAGLSLS